MIVNMLLGIWIILIMFIVLIIINNINILGINNNNRIISVGMIGRIADIRRISLLYSIMILYITIYWWYIYSNSSCQRPGGYELIERVNTILIGIDSISIYFIILIGLILPLCIIGNWNNIKVNIGLYNIIIIILGILLLINFICIDILSFYILFESTLIPLFILISIYGGDKTRSEKAAYYVLIYTLVSSLFMLISICVTTYLLNTTSYLIYTQYVLSLDIQILLWLGIMLAILVKSPLYPLHIWLPVVHSESPLGGSILLASIVLKLTIYLIIRWMLPFLSEATILYYPTIYIICILTIIITSLITIVQIDLKVIIAYSSISHMAVCIIGVFSNNIIGIEGSYILALAHGFISPGLFIAVGGVLYDRYHTRIILYYNGLLSYMPIFSLYFIILSFANIGTPLSANFIGEFLSLYGAFNNSPIFISIATFSVLLSATYQMKFTSRLTGGKPSEYTLLTNDITNRESILLLSTILPSLFIGLYPNFILNSLYMNISNVLYL